MKKQTKKTLLAIGATAVVGGIGWAMLRDPDVVRGEYNGVDWYATRMSDGTWDTFIQPPEQGVPTQVGRYATQQEAKAAATAAIAELGGEG